LYQHAQPRQQLPHAAQWRVSARNPGPSDKPFFF